MKCSEGSQALSYIVSIQYNCSYNLYTSFTIQISLNYIYVYCRFYANNTFLQFCLLCQIFVLLFVGADVKLGLRYLALEMISVHAFTAFRSVCV